MKKNVWIFSTILSLVLFAGCSDKNSTTPVIQDDLTTSGVNSIPIATFDTLSINKDVRYEGQLTATDEDGDTLKYIIINQPSHGSVVLHDNGCFTYTPDTGYKGSDSFSYKASDDVSSCSVKTVTVDVNEEPIQTPTAPPTGLIVKALSTTVLELSWSDDSDNEEGFVIYQDGKLVASTKANETKKVICCGLKEGTTYNFEIRAKNMAGVSASASAQGTTKEVTTLPTAPTELKAKGVGKTCLRLEWKDNADNESGYEIYQDGNLIKTISSGCRCAVVENLTSCKSYTYEVKAINRLGASASASTSVDMLCDSIVTPTNTEPTATAQSITLDEDSSKTIILSGTDADSDTLTYTVVTAPSHGIFDGTIYTPTANYSGSDSFSFTASDGSLTSAPATVSITITDVAEPNTAPTATAQAITMDEDTTKAITLAGTDAEGDTLTYTVVTAPSHGTFDGTTYTPTANYFGEDSFTFKANDGALDSEPATVSIMITDVAEPNTAPTSFIYAEETTLFLGDNISITIGGRDDSWELLDLTLTSDIDGLLYTRTQQRGNINIGTAFTPKQAGTHTLTVKVVDGNGGESVSTKVFEVKERVNTAPVATVQSITLDEDTTKTITLAGTDPEGDALTYTVVTAPSHGTYDGTTYTPTANYFGADSFTFKANDGTVDSSPATVTITVTSINDAPTVDAGVDGNITEGDSYTPTPTASDSDGTIVTTVWTEGGTTLTFPKTDFTVGEHTLTVTVTDNEGATATDTLTLTVEAKPVTCTPLPKTGQMTSYTNFDDGDYQKGSEVDPRFERDSTKEVVADKVTGLMWQDDAAVASVTKQWLTDENYSGDYNNTSGDTATTYCANLTLGDFTDWRLPTIEELVYITDKGRVNPAIDPTFENVSSSYYWGSTTGVYDTSDAWFVHFYYGFGNYYAKDDVSYVRCVRDGQ